MNLDINKFNAYVMGKIYLRRLKSDFRYSDYNL